MSNFKERNFYNPTRGNIDFYGMIDEMVVWIQEKPELFYDIVVGCDSSSGQEPFFPVVIVILRQGQGGRFFIQKVSYQQRKFYSWKERILEEVLLSCSLALVLKEAFQQRTSSSNLPKLNYQLRYIHADVGENGATKDMIKEVIGLIQGNGFEAKIKPESYAASVVADRYS